MASQSNVTPKKKQAFLSELADGKSVTAGANRAGTSRMQFYRLRKKEKAFALQWDEAVEAGTDVLEDVAIQRAKDGSDTLVIFMLKSRRPDKFRDRTDHRISLEDATEEQVERALMRMSDKQLRRIIDKRS